jgi:hypothetical protein
VRLYFASGGHPIAQGARDVGIQGEALRLSSERPIHCP